MRVLDAADVTRLLDMRACISAVEQAFRARGEGRLAKSSVGGLELAIEDVAAAALVYERAEETGVGTVIGKESAEH